MEKFDETINHVTTAIAKNKLLGEVPTVLIAPNFKITLNKRNKDWDNETIRITGSAKNGNQGHPKASISLPRNALLFLDGNDTGDIFTQVRHATIPGLIRKNSVELIELSSINKVSFGFLL